MKRASLWLSLALALPLAGCVDAFAPSAPLTDGVQFGKAAGKGGHRAGPAVDLGLDVLLQDPSAPPLETYKVTFQAREGEAKLVAVNYRPGTHQGVGDPFLRFYIPAHALTRKSMAEHHHAVIITMTIDPVGFNVVFEPSGLVFSKKSPAQLTMCYEHADPDVNGDGVVDATDQVLMQELAFWYSESTSMKAWSKLVSERDAVESCVSSSIYHFSQYAVSW